VDLILFLSVAIIVVALTLPLLGMASDAVRRRFIRVDGAVASAASPAPEVELYVRDRLYGQRPVPAVTPIPRPARPVSGG
jgi:hypothetical protein